MPNKVKHLSRSAKTAELIIYIASRLKDKQNYGATLLGKALCLIDSMHYLKKGAPITELTYIKQEHGPTPDPAEYLYIRDILEANGDLKRINADYFGRKQLKFISTREPNIEVFEKNEIVLINDVIDSISDHNATEISDYTHQFIAWIVAREKEELPFYTFLLTSAEPETKDYEWAREQIEKYETSLLNAL